MVESEEAASIVKEASFMRSAISGCFAGMCQTYAGHPLDAIKVKIQTDKVGEFRGVWHCITDTFKKEGVRGFYVAATPALATAVVENTLVFGANEAIKNAIMRMQDDPTRPLSIPALAGVGAAAGFFQGIFACPFEVIKCTMLGNSAYRNPIECGRRVVAESGIKGLFRGFVPFVAREVPFYFIFFSSYEFFCGILEKRSSRTRDQLPAAEVFVAGGLAGCVSWTAVVPADTVKSVENAGKGAGSALATARQILAKDGVFKGLFRGWTPIMIRAFPANAATFLGFELCRRYLPESI
eukprot:m.25033 g.25033  ORF g.25033 m.25033 type:complete len:296 (-) comp8816_c0_seq2:337-1224(-)